MDTIFAYQVLQAKKRNSLGRYGGLNIQSNIAIQPSTVRYEARSVEKKPIDLAAKLKDTIEQLERMTIENEVAYVNSLQMDED